MRFLPLKWSRPGAWAARLGVGVLCLALLVAAVWPGAVMARVGGPLGWGADDVCRAARPAGAQGTQVSDWSHPDSAWTHGHCALCGVAGAAWAPAPELGAWRLRGPQASDAPLSIRTSFILCRPQHLMAHPRAPPAHTLNHV